MNEEIKNIITNIRSSKKRGGFFEKGRVWKFIKNTLISLSPFLFLNFILNIHYILNYSDVSVKPIGSKIEAAFDLVTMCSLSIAVIFMFLIFIVENFRNLIKNKKGGIFYKLKEIRKKKHEIRKNLKNIRKEKIETLILFDNIEFLNQDDFKNLKNKQIELKILNILSSHFEKDDIDNILLDNNSDVNYYDLVKFIKINNAKNEE